MKMMITGASRGIGAACRKKFENDYEVITIARTGDMTENGDLACLEFREMIVDKYKDIDVLINNAGIQSKNYFLTQELNQIAACHLMECYAARSTRIINMGSSSSSWVANSTIPNKYIYYSVSKMALKKFAEFLAVEYSCNITTLEPGRVGGTGMGKESKLKPDYIADVISWILDQPVIIDSIKLRGE